jgi:antitoxin component of RelBE/YafQ-DinJ toxin-antitoxin module
MTTLTIQIPDKKADLAKQILKELGATIISKKEKKHTPNAETVKAINELRSGKSGKVFDSAKELFASL